jgi:tetratricopeptide (TPR) repeat protein
MVTKQTRGLVAFILFVGFLTLKAQKPLNIRNGCNYYGAETEKDYYQFEPNSEARLIINELLSGSGLSGSSFQLKESNCSNALATTVNGVRYILYNPDFLRKFKQDAATKWAAYGVLAHEMGHHLNGHNLSEETPSVRKQFELEADKFAGNLLFHLHATIDEAQSGIKTIPLEGETYTHPSKTARLVATTNGWTAAYDLSRGVQPKAIEPPVDNEKLAKEWFDKGFKETNHYKEIEYFSKAIELKPNYKAAFFNRAIAKSDLGKYNEAITDYNQTIRLKPDDEQAFLNRGEVKRKLGMYTEAISDFDQAILLKHDYADAFNNRGVAKKELSKYTEAISDYNQAILLKPDYAEAFNNRGNAKKELRKYTEAISDYDQSIKIDPKYAKAYANKGCCLVAMNNKSRMGEAIDLINKGLAIDANMSFAKDCKAEAIKKLQER